MCDIALRWPARSTQLFPEALMAQLYRLSKGVPRIINVLCDRALLGAYTQGKERVDRATLARAAREVFGQRMARRPRVLHVLSALLILVAGGALALGAHQWVQRDSETPILSPAAEKFVAPPAKTTTAKTVEDVRPAETPSNALAWPADVPRAGSMTMAYAALFRAWGADFEDGDPCRQAESAGLRCRTARGGLDALREIDRPAVMSMRDAQGREFDVALTGLDDETATVSVGGETRSVALETLAAQWSGYYTVLWRLPPQAHTYIQYGDRGPAVAWLRTQLAQGRGGAAQTSENPVFDDALWQQVKQFQLEQGLMPDGIAGPRTLMRLNVVSEQSAPTLLRENGKSTDVVHP